MEGGCQCLVGILTWRNLGRGQPGEGPGMSGERIGRRGGPRRASALVRGRDDAGLDSSGACGVGRSSGAGGWVGEKSMMMPKCRRLDRRNHGIPHISSLTPEAASAERGGWQGAVWGGGDGGKSGRDTFKMQPTSCASLPSRVNSLSSSLGGTWALEAPPGWPPAPWELRPEARQWRR